jgi:hypothetical protein
MEDVGIFYGLLVYFTAIWYILWPFGILVGYWVYFLPFGYVVARKIWQPWLSSPKISTCSVAMPNLLGTLDSEMYLSHKFNHL